MIQGIPRVQIHFKVRFDENKRKALRAHRNYMLLEQHVVVQAGERERVLERSFDFGDELTGRDLKKKT